MTMHHSRNRNPQRMIRRSVRRLADSCGWHSESHRDQHHHADECFHQNLPRNRAENRILCSNGFSRTRIQDEEGGLL
jgi:hypothetical protein